MDRNMALPSLARYSHGGHKPAVPVVEVKHTSAPAPACAGRGRGPPGATWIAAQPYAEGVTDDKPFVLLAARGARAAAARRAVVHPPGAQAQAISGAPTGNGDQDARLPQGTRADPRAPAQRRVLLGSDTARAPGARRLARQPALRRLPRGRACGRSLSS